MEKDKDLVLRTIIFGSGLEKVQTEDQIVYIKGQYIINRDEDDYSECDTDKQTLSQRKKHKVEKYRAKYNIDESKLDRKVAICIVIPFCVVSFIHYMTRFAIAVAAQAGMKESLQLKENQYNIASSVFFVPYVIFELLSNILLKYVRPHYFMSFYIVMLGITVLCNAFVTNFAGLVACRMFTGMFQSNSSALYYILANYYPNYKAQKVFTAYYSFGSIGGILSFLLVKVTKSINLGWLNPADHWRWIFVIEGIITLLLGVLLFFIIPDFPEGARFLDDDETIFLVKKLEVYSGRSGYQLKITFRDILSVLGDPLLWWGAMIYLGVLSCSYGYAFFEPSIVHMLATDINNNVTTNETLLEAIPFIFAFFIANLFAFCSDYFRVRSPFILLGIAMALTGLLLIDVTQTTDSSTSDPSTMMRKYYGCCLCIVGLSSTIPIVVCWVALNFGGHLRKNVSTAWLVSFCSTSGIFSTYLFLSKDAPNYRVGIWTNFGFLLFSLFCMLVYLFLLFKANKKKAYASYREEFNNLTIREKTFLGDKSPSFKYLY